ncbi:MAG: type II secretion system protein [Planctomycetota bacterium]|nr:type II secretion system protein [Planctomycetota bacterium]
MSIATRVRAGRAFTLIECVVAIVILGVATPGMFMALRAAANNSMAGIQASRARWLIQDKLEDIIADRHSASRGYSYLTSSNYPAEATIPGYPGFSRSVTLAATNAGLSAAGTGYLKVTVTVSYSDWNATSRSLSVATVLTDYTP